MATRTRAQLVARAADKLFLTGNGQPLEADDSAFIDLRVDELIEQLSADGVVDIPDLSEIDVRYFNPLAELLANVCATEFGQVYSPERKLQFEAELRRTSASRPTYEAQRVDYF